MKDTIDTIPLTDAFQAQDECAFCSLQKKLEQDAISFTLGSSYMEDDLRSITDKVGFCPNHFKKLYDYGNRLGLALILHTHYKEVSKQLDLALAKTSLLTPSFFEKLTRSKHTPNTVTPASELITNLTSSCYICNCVEQNMTRYIETFFHLLSTNAEFKETFKCSKGLCLNHFSTLINHAPRYLNEVNKDEFFLISKTLLTSNLKRIEEEIGWFIDKYDYRNHDAPWNNSKDSVPRAIQKLSGIYVQDNAFQLEP